MIFEGEVNWESFEGVGSVGLSLQEAILDDNGKAIDLRVICVNDYIEVLTKMPKKVFAGRTFKEIYPNIDSNIIHTCGQIIQTGQARKFKVFLKTQNKYLKVHGVVTKSNQLLLVWIDYTEEYLASLENEKNQREVEKLLEMLELGLTSGGVDIWDYDVTSDIITFFDYKRLFFASITEEKRVFSMKEHMFKITDEDRHYFIREFYKAKYHPQNLFELNYRIFSERKGRVIWLKVTGKVIEYDDAGHALRAVGIGQDITESIENEQRLLNHQKMLEQAQRIAHLGGWEYKYGTDQVYLSDEAIHIFEIKCPNVISFEQLTTLFDPEDFGEINKMIRILEDDNQFDGEFVIHTLKGNKRIHMITTRYNDQNGNPTNVIGTVQDVTERVQLEEKLRQSEKMTAVGQLAGGIAHDFNNILMAANGYTELIKFGTKDANIQYYCDKIITSIKNAAELTKKLLAYSRKDNLLKEAIHVHECINKVLEILVVTFDKKISFETELFAINDLILADAAEIENVFMNLCINARDAMPIGGVISISTEVIEIKENNCRVSEFTLAHGDYLVTHVKDSGTGIEPNILKKIFEPFFTTKEVGKGTGLGLAAIYGTILSHLGAITVDSYLGAGTNFTIYLPILKRRAEDCRI